jgi:glycosyltransferase involved in cell wall biosynthesis
MTLSVVIPTRDRPATLADALRTLAAQDVAPGVLDVVVVDDGSAGDLAPVVAAAATERVPMRLERQEPAGLNAARDRGVAVTRGEIVAFLDDDVLVAPGWARAVLDTFARSGCAGLAGRIVLLPEVDLPRWLTPRRRRYLSELDLGGAPRELDARAETPVGANCAVTRAAHERAGGFRPGLDRSGTALISNGDVEFFRRVREAGGTLVYAPEASVLHRVPAERLTESWFVRRAFAQGVSDELLRAPATRRPGRALRVAREVVRCGRAAPILARRLAEGRGPADARFWVSYCRGRMAAVRGETAT